MKVKQVVIGVITLIGTLNSSPLINTNAVKKVKVTATKYVEEDYND